MSQVMPYLKEYTKLNPQEKRQLAMKRQFKSDFPGWDDSLLMANNYFNQFTGTKKLKVLDFGCGRGNFIIDESKPRIAFSVGIDVDPKNTRKNRSLDKIIFGDLSHPYLKNRRFDAAVSLWVFEHLADPDHYFSGIRRLLVPGGIFLILTPNKHFLLIRVKEIFDRINPKATLNWVRRLYGRKAEDIFPTYYRANTPKEIARIGKRTGYRSLIISENFDPSYLSFGKLTYIMAKIMYRSGLNLFKPHLIALFMKRK